MLKTLLLHIIIWLQEWITFRPFLKIKGPHILLAGSRLRYLYWTKYYTIGHEAGECGFMWDIKQKARLTTNKNFCYQKASNMFRVFLKEFDTICAIYYILCILYIYFSDMFVVFLKELRWLNMFSLPPCHNSISVPFLDLLTICSKKLIFWWFTNTSPLYGNNMPNIKILN